MLVLEWNNPRITVGDMESYLRNYLGDNYNGLMIDDSKMSILTYEVLSTDQEDSIRTWFYGINNIPQSVSIDTPKDTEGRQLTRTVVTAPNWHYSPRSLDFYTAKYKSLYNRSHYGDGTIDGALDMGDAYMSFFDASGAEIIKGESESATDYQVRLSSICTKTTVTFECTYDIDVFGAKMMIKNPPTERAYVWAIAAPDVPVEYGGNIVFMGGGMNLSFFADKSCVEYDGKTSSVIRYDPVYHSGKILVMAKHEAGAQIGIQFIVQYYSAH